MNKYWKIKFLKVKIDMQHKINLTRIHAGNLYVSSLPPNLAYQRVRYANTTL